jgi:hypothetical protein
MPQHYHMVAIYILFSSKSFHNSSTTSFASPDEPSSISETDALYLHPADGIGDTETALIIKQQTKYVLIKFTVTWLCTSCLTHLCLCFINIWLFHGDS